jgi:endonuclease/exonuclease/phosphatase family metal-dependent hydrolase
VKDAAIRVYSVHSETRISVDRRLDQLKAVLEDVAHYPKVTAVIVLGDFNTWQGGAGQKTRKFFVKENFQTPFDDRPTFSRRILFYPLLLRLDWIWLRNLEVLSSGIEKRISLSDHWPLWCVVKLKKQESLNE